MPVRDLIDEIAYHEWATRLYRTVPIASPVAGAEIAFTVPGHWILRPIALRARLVTSATVANRNVDLQVTDGVSVVLDCAAGTVQAASKTVDYNWSAAGTSVSSGSALQQTVPFTPAIILSAGWKLQTVTNLIDGTDQWSAVTLVCEQAEMGASWESQQRYFAERAAERGEFPIPES